MGLTQSGGPSLRKSMKDSEYELRSKREYLLQMGKDFTENYRDLKDLGSFLPTLGTTGQKCLHRSRSQGFPGSPVVENPPCNARDASSIPAMGRSHVPRGQVSPVCHNY